jgi:hypothetical protein
MIGQEGPPPVDAENSVRKFRNVWDRAVYCEGMAATVLDADAKARAGDQKVNGSAREEIACSVLDSIPGGRDVATHNDILRCNIGASDA